MIEYALNATPRHGLRRSVMSQLQTCSGPVALSTGAGRGQCCWPAWIRPGVRFDQRSLRLFATRTAARRALPRRPSSKQTSDPPNDRPASRRGSCPRSRRDRRPRSATDRPDLSAVRGQPLTGGAYTGNAMSTATAQSVPAPVVVTRSPGSARRRVRFRGRGTVGIVRHRGGVGL